MTHNVHVFFTKNIFNHNLFTKIHEEIFEWKTNKHNE